MKWSACRSTIIENAADSTANAAYAYYACQPSGCQEGRGDNRGQGTGDRGGGDRSNVFGGPKEVFAKCAHKLTACLRLIEMILIIIMRTYTRTHTYTGCQKLKSFCWVAVETHVSANNT